MPFTVTTRWGNLRPGFYSAHDATRDNYKAVTGRDDFDTLPTAERNTLIREYINPETRRVPLEKK